MTKATFSERLQQAMVLRNLKSSQIEKLSEQLFKEKKIKKVIKMPLITDYLKGRYEAKQCNIYALALILNVDEAWLMGADVSMKRQESNIFPISDVPLEVPVLGKISAGLPLLAVENIDGKEFAPSSYIKEDYEYFYLKVQGDSMNLKFPEGNLVLVQKQDTLENGEIGVILVNGFDATVKKYRLENEIVILEPMSSNPEHTIQIYNPKDIEIKIIGKVVMHIGKVN